MVYKKKAVSQSSVRGQATFRRGLASGLATGRVIVFLLFCFVFLALAVPVLAQSTSLPSVDTASLSQAANLPAQAGLILPSTDPRIIVAKIVRIALGFLGMVALLLVLYGGFLWMTSAGNEERIATAKKILINAGIGLAIILSALAIVQFIMNALIRSMSSAPLPPPLSAEARVGGGALGTGIIESHYPFRGATDVARNTRIIVTFKEAVDPTSIAELVPGVVPTNTPIYSLTQDGVYQYPTYSISGVNVSALRLKRDSGGRFPSAIQIIKTANIQNSTRQSAGTNYLGSDTSGMDILVSFTEDMRTFIFTPVDPTSRNLRKLIGSATEKISYTVYLCGTESSAGNCPAGGVKLLSGISAFQGFFKDYQWSFETGTFIDTTPPRVYSVMPIGDRGQDQQQGCPTGLWRAEQRTCDRSDKARNAMLQVNFSEAVLPTVVSGRTITLSGGVPAVPATHGDIKPGSYDEMRVFTPGPVYLAGRWQIANQYRTAEFTSEDRCGRNSCGQDVFCLPSLEKISTNIFAASIVSAGDPTSKGLFDGVEDVAGNSLDGNGDGLAQGPGNGTAFYDLYESTVAGQVDNARWSFYTSGNIDLDGPIIQTIVPDIEQRGVLPLTLPVETTFNKPMAISTFSSDNIIITGEEIATGARWDAWWTLEGQNLDSDGDREIDKTLARIVHGPFWEDTGYDMIVSSRVKDLFQNCYLPSAGVGCAVEALSLSCPYCCNGQPSRTNCANPTNCP